MATGSPTYHDFLPTPPTPDQSRSSLLPSSDQVHYGFVYCKKIRASTAMQSALIFPTIFRLFAPAWRYAHFPVLPPCSFMSDSMTTYCPLNFIFHLCPVLLFFFPLMVRAEGEAVAPAPAEGQQAAPAEGQQAAPAPAEAPQVG